MAMCLKCGGIFYISNVRKVLYCKSVGEKMLKIGQHLEKLEAKVVPFSGQG